METWKIIMLLSIGVFFAFLIWFIIKESKKEAEKYGWNKKKK